jgi:hypothetical protein
MNHFANTRVHLTVCIMSITAFRIAKQTVGKSPSVVSRSASFKTSQRIYFAGILWTRLCEVATHCGSACAAICHYVRA